MVSFIFLDYYESERPKPKIENSELENYIKEIKRAKIKLSLIFGVFAALAWLVAYHRLSFSN